MFYPATAFSKTFGGVLVRAAAHSIVQGTLAMMQSGGAGFLSGAAAGFFGSLGATAWGGAGGEWLGIGGKYASSTVGTIAFGALSGGVGASLTGGNFWEGAVTGGIVAGLNHVMHSFSQKIIIRQDLIGRLEAAGYSDPYAYANLSDSQLADFAQKVLPELYVGADCPNFESRDIIDNDSTCEGMTLGGINEKTNEFMFYGKILLAKSTFSSYLHLASTMGHELNHAIDYINGSMTYWYKRGGEGLRKANTELKAYRWEANNGGGYNTSMIQYYVNEQYLWNKYADFK